MPDYRAYIVGPDGRFMDFKPIDAVDDAEALRAAHALLDGHDIELWHLARKVGVIHAPAKE
jgi:hypothetical protein